MIEKKQPSGILIAWLGGENKPHTKSIPFIPYKPLQKKIACIEANAFLMCKQIDYDAGYINSMPMITMGLSRVEARQALVKELPVGNNDKGLGLELL